MRYQGGSFYFVRFEIIDEEAVLAGRKRHIYQESVFRIVIMRCGIGFQLCRFTLYTFDRSF